MSISVRRCSGCEQGHGGELGLAHGRREADCQRYQESLNDPTEPDQRTLSASEFKAWGDWEWYMLLNAPKPKRRRSVMMVALGAKFGEHGGWLSQSLRVPLPETGSRTQLLRDVELGDEEYPDDVETVRLLP